MNIVNKDVQRARKICSAKGAGNEKNAAHRRHRRNQKTVLHDMKKGNDPEADGVDFITRPASSWDII